MMLSQSIWALALLASTTAAMTVGTTSAKTVSLASFNPQVVQPLPSSCAKVYNTVIAACTPSDFPPELDPGATCSAACVRGLSAIGEKVKSECADVDVGETSIIGVFQNDLGIQVLCPGVTVVTSSSSSESKTTEVVKTSTTAAATTTTTSKEESSTTTAAAASSTTDADDDGDESSTAQETASSSSSSSSSTGGLTLDPNATGTLSTTTVVAPPTDTASSSTSGAVPTLAPNSQLSNVDSGGGSPFDIVATAGSSPQQRFFDSSFAGLLTVAVLLIVCA